MTTSANFILTAPCGCTFEGRVYSTRNCTVIDSQTATGTHLMRHAMSVKKAALREPSTAELFDIIAASTETASLLGVFHE